MERNFYGVFPLRGKLLNVREATSKQLKENKEIESIKKILGLQHDKQYINVKSLRYGHLMIMTDQVSASLRYFCHGALP
jgi:DNA topoisomerase-2